MSMTSVMVRPASLQDGVAVLQLLEDVGYFPEPIGFAQTYRKTLHDPHFLVRVAELDGQIVGMASLSMRYQLGLGGLLACLDEKAVKPVPEARRVERLLLRETVGRAKRMGVRKVVVRVNENTPPARPVALAKTA